MSTAVLPPATTSVNHCDTVGAGLAIPGVTRADSGGFQSSALFRWVLWAGVAAALCASLGGPLAGCSNKRNYINDAFAKDRLGALARSVTLATSAADTAERELVQTNALMEELSTRKDRDEAFSDGRRSLSRARGRVDTSTQRLKNVQTNAEALISEWTRESREYSNSELKARSRAELDDLRERWRPLDRVVQATQKSYAPLMQILSDDSLALKHRRSATGTLLDASDRTARDAAAVGVAEQTRELFKAARLFLKGLPGHGAEGETSQ